MEVDQLRIEILICDFDGLFELRSLDVLVERSEEIFDRLRRLRRTGRGFRFLFRLRSHGDGFSRLPNGDQKNLRVRRYRLKHIRELNSIALLSMIFGSVRPDCRYWWRSVIWIFELNDIPLISAQIVIGLANLYPPRGNFEKCPFSSLALIYQV